MKRSKRVKLQSRKKTEFEKDGYEEKMHAVEFFADP